VRLQAKTLCTTSRAKKIVVGLVVVALTAEAIKNVHWYLTQSTTIISIYAIVFQAVVPTTVLIINLMLMRR